MIELFAPGVLGLRRCVFKVKMKALSRGSFSRHPRRTNSGARMPTAQPAKKICVVCGTDVDGKPRVKDAEGRYVCKGECEVKLAKKAKAAANTTPLADADDVMSKLVAASPVINAKPCANCGSPLRQGSVVCTNCGTNTETGKKLKTAIIKEKEEKAPKPGKYTNKYAGYSSEPNVWKMFFIFSLILSVVGLLPALKPELGLASLVILIIASILGFWGGAIAAFRNDQTLWGICHILCIVPGINFFAYIAVLAYNALFNEDQRSRAMFWATFIGNFMFGVGIAISVLNNTPVTLPGIGTVGGGGTGP